MAKFIPGDRVAVTDPRWPKDRHGNGVIQNRGVSFCLCCSPANASWNTVLMDGGEVDWLAFDVCESCMEREHTLA